MATDVCAICSRPDEVDHAIKGQDLSTFRNHLAVNFVSPLGPIFMVKEQKHWLSEQKKKVLESFFPQLSTFTKSIRLIRDRETATIRPKWRHMTPNRRICSGLFSADHKHLVTSLRWLRYPEFENARSGSLWENPPPPHQNVMAQAEVDDSILRDETLSVSH